MGNKGVSYQVKTGYYANFTSLAAPKNQSLNPNFITGFIDGEGCFHITMAKKTGYRTGYCVNLSFSIGLHSKDADLLRSIQEYFGGIGILSVSGSTVYWRVFSVKELKVIIDHLDEYPLLTKKYLDFVLFKEAFRLFVNKTHLTDEGLINIASIKASMNLGLSETLKAAFPTYGIIDPLSLSKGLIAIQVGKSINPYWVAGFTEAEGCFFVTIQENKSTAAYQIKIGYQVTQHIRDQALIKSLKDFFGCGRSEPSGKAAISFRVTKFKDIAETVVPFFDNYPILGSKLQDFLDFKCVVKLMASKSHLTPEGLNEIKKIKSRMNSLR